MMTQSGAKVLLATRSPGALVVVLTQAITDAHGAGGDRLPKAYLRRTRCQTRQTPRPQLVTAKSTTYLVDEKKCHIVGA